MGAGSSLNTGNSGFVMVWLENYSVIGLKRTKEIQTGYRTQFHNDHGVGDTIYIETFHSRRVQRSMSLLLGRPRIKSTMSDIAITV